MSGPAQPRRAIVNADDLGMSRGITEGILRAHAGGIVTSATIMVNSPFAEDAAKRLREFPSLGVGVHLNASQGPVLSKEGEALVNADGVMEWKTPALAGRCVFSPKLLRAIEAEFDAQIRRALDLGIRPTHLDTHRHLHAFPPVFRRVVKLAARYGVPFVRRPYERLKGRGWPEPPAGGRQRRLLLNHFSRMNARSNGKVQPTLGTWGIAHTGQIDAAWLIRAAASLPEGVTEIMTHPGLADDVDPALTRLTQSRARELDALCDPEVRRAFEHNHVELVHYGDLA